MTFQMPEISKPDYNRRDNILSNIKPISAQFSDALTELQDSQSAQIYVKQIQQSSEFNKYYTCVVQLY